MNVIPDRVFVRRCCGLLVRVSVVAWLVIHFALTVLYVMPENPIRMGMWKTLNATIGTYFYQNWSFFAPNPLSSDYALLARPLTRVETNRISAHGLPPDGWYDLSSPLWTRFQQNRFSAYDRLTRPQSSAIRSYLAGGPELAPWWDSCVKGDRASCLFYEEQLKRVRVEASTLLRKIGSAFCKDLLTPASEVTHVAMRVREKVNVPWSERHVSRPVTRDIELGVYAIDWSISSPALYVDESLR